MRTSTAYSPSVLRCMYNPLSVCMCVHVVPFSRVRSTAWRCSHSSVPSSRLMDACTVSSLMESSSISIRRYDHLHLRYYLSLSVYVCVCSGLSSNAWGCSMRVCVYVNRMECTRRR